MQSAFLGDRNVVPVVLTDQCNHYHLRSVPSRIDPKLSEGYTRVVSVLGCFDIKLAKRLLHPLEYASIVNRLK